MTARSGGECTTEFGKNKEITNTVCSSRIGVPKRIGELHAIVWIIR